MNKTCGRSAVLLFVLAAGVSIPWTGAAADDAATADATPATQAEAARWRTEAADSAIVRDEWGIAHVHGKTDADAVFGMIYAQAEDDFNRVETNYLGAMGRLAEAEGEAAIFQDLRMRLFIRPEALKGLYGSSPAWLRTLMVAWADGLNFFLATHPAVHPRVIAHFEPWMALSFTEGSIGGDVERVPLDALQAFYGAGGEAAPSPARDLSTAASGGSIDVGGAGTREPGGSNGIAIAPANTVAHHALLLINPHTSFFFRSELQMTSDTGLNAYGAATWGQFFIYQGFNSRLGWMHTSSGVDNVDFFLESTTRRSGKLLYRYGRELRPVQADTVEIAYRTPTGALAKRQFTVYRTHHGPVIRQIDGRWVSIALMQRPVAALSQSFLLTKAANYGAFMQAMALQANSSNNTVYADADGNIAYLHPQFVPRRADRFDYTHPVDGADPATDWQGLHALDELPRLLNPATGWIMNTNDWPYAAAGDASPRRADFPRYMDTAGENPRGLHAALLLTGRRDFTADALNAAAYDSYLPAFAELIPTLIAAYDAQSPAGRWRAGLADQVQALREWDYRWSAHSVATTLAALWGDQIWDVAKQDADAENVSVYADIGGRMSADTKLAALAAVSERLQRDFGTWRVPWGEVNRQQRSTGDIVQHFNDAAPSLPVPFTSARWGSLASFGARRYPGTSRYYGTSGNSFVAIVEFGPRIEARAVSIGGESGDPQSRHFRDQAVRYSDGALRKVYFYPDDLAGHVEREYHPH
jgi:acyl-homoserine-lactone acylase